MRGAEKEKFKDGRCKYRPIVSIIPRKTKSFCQTFASAAMQAAVNFTSGLPLPLAASVEVLQFRALSRACKFVFQRDSVECHPCMFFPGR